MNLVLCTGVQPCWNSIGPVQKCSDKVGSMTFSKMSGYAIAFTETKGPSPAREKQPHIIILHSPNLKLGKMHSDLKNSPGKPPNADSSIRFPDRETWFVTLGSRSPLPLSPVAVCFTPLHLIGCIILGDECLDVAARQWKPIHETHEFWRCVVTSADPAPSVYLWMSCCHSQTFPFSYGIFRREEISWLNYFAHGQPFRSSTVEFIDFLNPFSCL